jgi:predicted amidophosphoribosyltransferase
MECKKCKASVSEDSKFCNQCGTQIEKEKSDLEQITEMCRRIWFLIGFLKAKGDSGKKKEK